MELDSHQSVFLDRDIQPDSRLAMLREGFLELTKQLRVRASTNCDDLFAHRSSKRQLEIGFGLFLLLVAARFAASLA